MDNGEIIYMYDQSEIKTETKNFYKTLYQQNKVENVDFDLNNGLSYEYVAKLSIAESNCLEDEITLETRNN